MQIRDRRLGIRPGESRAKEVAPTLNSEHGVFNPEMACWPVQSAATNGAAATPPQLA